MNNKLMKTIKRALLTMYKTFNGETLSVSKDLSTIVLDKKRVAFNNTVIDRLRNDVQDACRDIIASKDKVSQ